LVETRRFVSGGKYKDKKMPTINQLVGTSRKKLDMRGKAPALQS